ncbi:hypothetical protein SDC9_131149 [bioreactor metagenome]|uniref:Uncharacterized protein n=1 Tax=bioreactor metagenome TaxID=1076179 RepID=A0A645D4S9_9ZZZZ
MHGGHIPVQNGIVVQRIVDFSRLQVRHHFGHGNLGHQHPLPGLVGQIEQHRTHGLSRRHRFCLRRRGQPRHQRQRQ